MHEPIDAPSIRRSARRRWVPAVFGCSVLILLGISLAGQQVTNTKENRNQRQLQAQALENKQQAAENKIVNDCIARWAKLTSERSSFIAKYNLQKEDASLDLASVPQDNPRHAAALAVYRQAEAELARELALYPPPIYTCNAPIPTASLVPSPTSPRLPTPTVTTTKTTTATATATTSLVGPGPVIRLPGPTTTVTAPGHGHNKTVTKTVSPPSCLTNPVPPCVLG